jgi:hypothetical protein
MGTNQQRSFRSLLAAKMVPEVGIAPTSPPLQGGANLPQLLGVLAHGNNWSSPTVTFRGLPVISRARGRELIVVSRRSDALAEKPELASAAD